MKIIILIMIMNSIKYANEGFIKVKLIKN